MRLLMRLGKNGNFSPADRERLRKAAYDSVRGFGADIGNLGVSSYAEASPIDSSHAIRLGSDLFNEERYWESHEALESVWRRAKGEEKDILQGLIVLAAALIHLQKNELDVTLSILKRAYAKLADHRGEYHGPKLESLKEKVKQMLLASRPHFFKINIGR